MQSWPATGLTPVCAYRCNAIQPAAGRFRAFRLTQLPDRLSFNQHPPRPHFPPPAVRQSDQGAWSMPPSLPARVALAFFVALVPASAGFAQAPLHQRIDQLIRDGRKDYAKVAAPLASDAEFLRRVYLDTTGDTPTADEARAFFADTAPDKRAKLIDRLLASERYAVHMATVFDVLLMDRRA